MGIPCDDFVVFRQPESSGEPTIITVNCPDKTGLGCDLCRIILFFGLSIVRGDVSTDGKWCFIVFWVVGRDSGSQTRWSLLKKRLLGACPAASPAFGLYNSYYRLQELLILEQQPQVFLLKFSCCDRLSLLHDVTQVLCELELIIRRVKVSTTPDGRIMDLFFITDTRELLHTKKRKDETIDNLRAVLGDSMTSCDIELASADIAAVLQASCLPPAIIEEMSSFELPEEPPGGKLPPLHNLQVTMDNSLSPAHTLIQIVGPDHKGLLYDIMRTLKDYNIQISYGRFYASQNGISDLDLFVIQMDGKKIIDPNKQRALCERLRLELFHPLRVTVASRGPDTELLVANPVELSGKGRPLVFYDITLALKLLHTRIFLAEIGRHFIGGREWEVYRILLDDDHESIAPKDKIVEKVTKMLMGWE